MKKINALLNEIKKFSEQDEDILCVFLFGSHVKGRPTQFSDVDVCFVLNINNYSPLILSQKKLAYMKIFPHADIQIFQQLPLYIKVRILKYGKIILCKEEDKIYDIAFSVITEYSDYEHIYREYLSEIENAG